jgi:hypothetical protein
VVDELKAISISRVRSINGWTGFLSNMLEEKTFLQSHLASMNGLHGRLVHGLLDDIKICKRWGVVFTSPTAKDWVMEIRV